MKEVQMNAQHMKAAPSRDNLKKAGIATAVAAATLLGGASTAMAAPADVKPTCTPNKDDVAKQEKVQDQLADARAAAMKAATDLDKAKKNSATANKAVNNAKTAENAAHQALDAAKKQAADDFNAAVAAHKAAKDADAKSAASSENQKQKADAYSAAILASKDAQTKANNAKTAVDKAQKNLDDSVNARKGYEKALTEITIRQTCTVPMTPLTPAKPADHTKPAEPGNKPVQPSEPGKPAQPSNQPAAPASKTAAKSAASAKAAVTPAAQASKLAKTGADSLAAISVATLLIGAGAGLTLVRRNN